MRIEKTECSYHVTECDYKFGTDITLNGAKLIPEETVILEQESLLDNIKGYIDHVRNTGMGKKKSLEFIEKFIDGLKAESENA